MEELRWFMVEKAYKFHNSIWTDYLGLGIYLNLIKDVLFLFQCIYDNFCAHSFTENPCIEENVDCHFYFEVKERRIFN
jgi:hypothetical protein